MTYLALATTQELMAELDKRLARVIVIGAFINEQHQDQTFLFTGHTTDLNYSLGMCAWAKEALLIKARASISPGTTGLYGGS